MVCAEHAKSSIPPRHSARITLRRKSPHPCEISGLSVFAELSGGRYPKALGAKSTLPEAAPLLQAKYGYDVGNNETGKRKTHDIFLAPAYCEKLVRENRDVRYYGDKVTAADANAVLMRWKISDTQYRVIFGDLRTEDVAPDRLAQLEANASQ